MKLETHPLTPDRWSDFEALMGPRGGADGCWCTYWRQPAAAYRDGKGEGNRRSMQARVQTGERPPGLLGYIAGMPVGWVSIAPRDEFPRMARSRIVGPLDGRPVWSVNCFFIKAGHRGEGVATALLRAACDFAASHGAEIVEGYPIDPLGGRYANAFAWTGLARSFEQVGFTEVARRSEKRPIMRRTLAR